jgi:hypothetical protein
MKISSAYRMAGILLMIVVLSLAGAVAVSANIAYWVVGAYSGTYGTPLYAVDSAGNTTQVNYGALKVINFIAQGNDGFLYCLGTNTATPVQDAMWRINLTTGLIDPTWSVGTFGTNSAHANMMLKCGPDGNLYFTQSGNSYITQVNPVTQTSTQISLGGGTIPTTSGGIAFDTTGEFCYVAQEVGAAYEVRQYDMWNSWTLSPSFVVTDPINPGTQQIYGICGGSDGYLYTTNYYKAPCETIYRFSQTTGVWDTTFSATTAAGGTNTRGKDISWSVANGTTTLYATTNSAYLVALTPVASGLGQNMPISCQTPVPYNYLQSMTLNTLPVQGLVANVTLKNYSGDMSLVNIRVDIRNTADTTTLYSQYAVPAAQSGGTSVTNVTFPILPAGNYLVRASAGKWLTSSANTTVALGQMPTVSLSLLNGDLNGDNFVEDQDYSIMGVAWYQGGN